MASRSGSTSGTVPLATTPSPLRLATAARVRRVRTSSPRSAFSSEQTTVRLSTMLRWSSATNVAAGRCSRSSGPWATSERVCRSTTWNSSSTPRLLHSPACRGTSSAGGRSGTRSGWCGRCTSCGARFPATTPPYSRRRTGTFPARRADRLASPGTLPAAGFGPVTPVNHRVTLLAPCRRRDAGRSSTGTTAPRAAPTGRRAAEAEPTSGPAHAYPSTVLVGRDPELAVLRERLACAREGASSCLVISGEAGVGKSRLLDEIAQAEAGVPLLRTTCVSAEAGLPFAALSDLLRPVLQHLPDLPSEYQEALRAALALGPPISDTRCPVALALLGLLSAVATDAGVLVLVDDAQWLDQASADALLMLAHRLDAEGVLLVLAAGDGEGEATRLADLPRLPLGGLRPAEAQALLRAAAGQPAAEDVLQRLVAGAAGNPLALLHVARTLTTGQWRGRDPLPAPLPVGPRLQEAYAARVSDLPSRTRLALLLAATATGRRDVVRTAAARLGLSDANLDAAVSAGLVAVERGQVVFP